MRGELLLAGWVVYDFKVQAHVLPRRKSEENRIYLGNGQQKVQAAFLNNYYY